MKVTKVSRRTKLLRRDRDILAVVAVMPFLLPLMAVIFTLKFVFDGWPVFFVQGRVGKNGRPIKIWKYRTMVVNAPLITEDVPLEKDWRVTWMGYYLRKFKLDEIPQIFQVLWGTLTLVGMRPEMDNPIKISRYNPSDWTRRIRYSPGLFCLSQLFDEVPMCDRRAVRMDLRYLRKQTLWTDFKLTVQLALRLAGIMDCPIKKAVTSRENRFAKAA